MCKQNFKHSSTLLYYVLCMCENGNEKFTFDEDTLFIFGLSFPTLVRLGYNKDGNGQT